MTTRKPRAGSAQMFVHQRILADIQGKILSGEWEVGRRIPVEHELMKQYACSRMTVSKVLTRLAHAGLIERHRKVGSFVARPHSHSAVLEIPDIKAEVTRLGLPYAYDIMRRSRRRSVRGDNLMLGKEGSVPVLELSCLHMAGDKPFCLEQRTINLQAVPEIADEQFTEQSPGAWLLRRVPWRVAEHRIRAAPANPEEAAALKLRAKSPCLIVERTTRGADSIITFVRLTYPGSVHELVATFTPFAPMSAAKTGAAGSATERVAARKT